MTPISSCQLSCSEKLEMSSSFLEWVGANSSLNKEGGVGERTKWMPCLSFVCLLSGSFPPLAALFHLTGNCSAQAPLLTGFWAGRSGEWKTAAEDWR